MLVYILIKKIGFNSNLSIQNVSLFIFHFQHLAAIVRFYLSIRYIIQNTDYDTDIYLFTSKDVLTITWFLDF